MSTGTQLQTIIEQLQTILILLERPVVQRQLVAIMVSALVAWLLRGALTYLQRRYLLPEHVEGEIQPLWQRWLRAMQPLYFPILGICGARRAISFFEVQGFPNGLLISALIFFWIVLIYGALLTLLFALFGKQRVELYQKWLLFPLFISGVSFQFIDNIIDLNLLGQLELLVFFETSITLGRLLAGFLVFYLFIVITWFIQDLLLKVIMPQITLDVGLINSTITVSRYFILTIGLFVAIATLGFDLSTLAFIGGGLTIALGFGLQQVTANFVSGILLLFEQALRPGDVIKINGEVGTVEQLRIRSTLVRTFDNIELIIPNENLLNSVVTTYTKTDRLVRLTLPITISRDTDPEKVRDILLQTAAQHDLVLKELADHEPTVFFMGFGESALNFNLYVWIDQLAQMVRVRSDLNFMIWKAFAEHDIEIPFPQRDLNLREGWQKVRGRGGEGARGRGGEA